MRTWKQGAVGQIIFPESKSLYLKCLKYPLAVFYKSFDPDQSEPEDVVFCSFVRKSVLNYISKSGCTKMSKDEIKFCRTFTMNFTTNEITSTGSGDTAVYCGKIVLDKTVRDIDDLRKLYTSSLVLQSLTE